MTTFQQQMFELREQVCVQVGVLPARLHEGVPALAL